TGYNWITDRVRTVALTHAIAHVVARFNGHIDGSVLTGKHGLDPANDIITAELLTRVCRKHACQCFNPEGDVQPATDVVRTDGGIEDKETVTLTDAGVQD